MARRCIRPLHGLSCLAVAALTLTARPVAACSVCFGDPNSPMAKGAVMGIYVLLGVVGSVLAVLAGTGIYWIQRGRRLAHDATAGECGDEGNK